MPLAGLQQCSVLEVPGFASHPWIRGPHLQTLFGHFANRGSAGSRLRQSSLTDHVRTPDDDLLRLHWHSPDVAASSPVLILLHGLTGCAASPNVLATAAKATVRGFETVRVDLRNAHAATPSRGLGHAGRSDDLRVALEHVRALRPRAQVAVIGFSLGGTIALKAAAELAAQSLEDPAAIAVVSAPIDLDRASGKIDNPTNWPYRRYFLRRLRTLYRRRRRQHPQLYPEIDLDSIATLRRWDDAVVARLCGFAGASDYYDRCSSLRMLDQIRCPTAVIQARDDPFIPFEDFQDRRLSQNRCIYLCSPPEGGHVGFYGRRTTGDPDAFWAENRALDFCALACRSELPLRFR